MVRQRIANPLMVVQFRLKLPYLFKKKAHSIGLEPTQTNLEGWCSIL